MQVLNGSKMKFIFLFFIIFFYGCDSSSQAPNTQNNCNNQCLQNEICENNVCVTSPGFCDALTPCIGVGEVCNLIITTCIQNPCQTYETYDGNTNSCFLNPGNCYTVADCAANQVCTNNVCVNITTPIKVTTGFFHNCMLMSDNSINCFGNNRFGQLGNGITENASDIVPEIVLNASNVLQLVTGNYHSCFMLGANDVKCFGDNQYGELGNETNTASSTPVSVSNLINVNYITSGLNHNCALLNDGKVNCWGDNQFGQLGNNSMLNSNIPVEVMFVEEPEIIVTFLSSGGNHNCVITSLGFVYCWGFNGYGQLGINEDFNDYSTCRNENCAAASERRPKELIDFLNVTSIYCGGTHTCAFKGTDLYCFGGNQWGQLGNGTYIATKKPPLTTTLTGYDSVKLGGGVTCGIQGGNLKCFGRNDDGELGNGTYLKSNIPINVTNGIGIIDYSIGQTHNCFIDSMGLKCFGNNSQKQLGVIGIENSNIPVAATNFSY